MTDNLKLANLFNIEGKTAVVTGGSRGIGEMIAAGLLANGATVYISSRKAEVCDATAERLQETYGGTCVSLPADLSTIDGIDGFNARLREHTDAVDILVNNAGASWGAKLEEFPENGWDKVMDTNVKGVFFLTQRLLPMLEKNATSDDPSRIINIGSVDGLTAPGWDTFSYSSSKAAVHHLTRHLASHLTRRHIVANAIAPGPYPTWMLSTGVGTGGDVDGTDWDLIGRSNPRGRVGTPEDIVGLTLFLSSRAGAYVVGEVITTDGGTIVAGRTIPQV